jgi:hypothetical protein
MNLIVMIQAQFKGIGDGGFPGSGETGEPDDERRMVFNGGALGLGEFVGVGGEVRQGDTLSLDKILDYG